MALTTWDCMRPQKRRCSLVMTVKKNMCKILNAKVKKPSCAWTCFVLISLFALVYTTPRLDLEALSWSHCDSAPHQIFLFVAAFFFFFSFCVCRCHLHSSVQLTAALRPFSSSVCVPACVCACKRDLKHISMTQKRAYNWCQFRPIPPEVSQIREDTNSDRDELSVLPNPSSVGPGIRPVKFNKPRKSLSRCHRKFLNASVFHRKWD